LATRLTVNVPESLINFLSADFQYFWHKDPVEATLGATNLLQIHQNISRTKLSVQELIGEGGVPAVACRDCFTMPLAALKLSSSCDT
jgi:hypothetical protein